LLTSGSIGPTGAGVVTANAIASGTSGANLTTLNASNLSSGTVPTARLGTGTADATSYLRGDGAWTVPYLTGSVSLGGSTISKNACATTTTTVTGAAPGMFVMVTPVSPSWGANAWSWDGYASNTDQVTVRLCNGTGVNSTPGATTFNIRVMK
jgi:hypothetical protein